MKLAKMLSIVALFALAITLPTSAADTESYGEAMELTETTPIAEIVADPDRFDGERVRVSGEIEGVCPMKGCWMNLRQGSDLVRIKVEDDVIVFPKDAIGSEATAEGIVEVQEMSREDYVGYHEHLAEELGREFDPESIGDGPYRMVQIRGIGAEIEREQP